MGKNTMSEKVIPLDREELDLLFYIYYENFKRKKRVYLKDIGIKEGHIKNLDIYGDLIILKYDKNKDDFYLILSKEGLKIILELLEHYHNKVYRDTQITLMFIASFFALINLVSKWVEMKILWLYPLYLLINGSIILYFLFKNWNKYNSLI